MFYVITHWREGPEIQSGHSFKTLDGAKQQARLSARENYHVRFTVSRDLYEFASEVVLTTYTLDNDD